MASKSSYTSAQGTSEGLPRHTVYDTAAEMPSSGLQEGDTAYSKDDDKFYKATNSTTWVAITGGAGASAFSDLTGTASVAQGGTGASSGPAAYINLGTMPATNLSGTVAIVNGGTGQSNANAALNALLPSQGGNSGEYLTTNGTDASWATVVGGSPFTTVRKTGLDQGSSGTGLLNSVNQMDFTLASSTNYVFEYWIRYQTAANTTGLVLGLQTAQTPVGLWMHWTTPLASTGTVTGGSAIGSNTTLSIASGNVASGGVQLAYLTGMVMGGATGGTMSLRWCSEVTGSMCTIKTGSMARIMAIT